MQNLIYPMAAVAGLTFVIMYLLLVLRVKAVSTRKVSPEYFKLNKGGELPDKVVAVSQNFNNLLELPVLFYTVCILAIIINQSLEYFVMHAWTYVVLRYLHSFIHITYNNIVHRLVIFGLSSIVLVSMWIKVLLIAS